MIVVYPDNITNARSGQPNRSVMLPYNPGPAAVTAEGNFFQSSFPLIFTPIGPSTATPNNAQTAAGSEAHIMTLGRNAYAVQVSGTFSATILIEASLDGQNWVQLDTITAASIKQYTGVYAQLRLSISAYTSGTPQVTVVIQR